MSVNGNPKVLAGLIKRIGNVKVPAVPIDFDQRLILQKTVSILQDGPGIDLGYDFNWYHRGPYSPALARDAFQMVGLYPSAKSRSFVDPLVEQRFAGFISFLRPHYMDPVWLENFGSILYLRKRQFGPGRSYLLMLKKCPTMTRPEFDDIWSQVGTAYP